MVAKETAASDDKSRADLNFRVKRGNGRETVSHLHAPVVLRHCFQFEIEVAEEVMRDEIE